MRENGSMIVHGSATKVGMQKYSSLERFFEVHVILEVIA